ncbi:HlyD family secretion protein [Leptolyngbya sp. GGD]|uniref:HlyD family secretion protein n=1 Tax=Leptolyngbya sp. GGD TaxID=2997907 RepID=UPI00227D5678|nr:HlyD family secretion protein [Leptolyngbya sp. GGD]MCY6491380.1 HlyD family secretion protein [Leptolyngbya sp. GGD]
MSSASFDDHAPVQENKLVKPAPQLDQVTPKVVAPPEQPVASRRKKPMKLILAGLGVGAIAASGFGYNWWQYASAHQSTNNATVTGNIHSIGSRVSGTVDQVLVDDNQDVKAGQPLIRLDDRDFQIKLQQAQADLAAAQQKANTAQVNVALSGQNATASNTKAQGGIGTAQAAIAQAQAQVAEAQAGVPRAQADLAQTNANLAKAQADYNRFNQLFSSGAVSRRELDTARQAYEVARAQRDSASEGVRQAQAKVAQAEQGVATAQAGLESSQGELQQAQAQNVQTQVSQSDYQTAQAAINQSQVALKNAKQQLEYVTITAPVSGRVGRKNVQTGQQVQAGTPLLAIVDDQYWVTANFKETQLEKMHPGQKVEIKLDSFPHHEFTGRIESVSPASGAQFALLPPDNATGNFTKVVQRIPVKVVFDRESIRGFESAVTPGMSAEVTVDLNS